MDKIIRVGLMKDVRVIRANTCEDALATYLDRKPVSTVRRGGKDIGNVL